MDLLKNVRVLTSGLVEVLIETKAYEKDDKFMETYTSGECIRTALKNYLNMEKFCFFIKRKNLFYRTPEELNDLFSDAFIEAFFRGGNYPVKSYKGFNLVNGTTRTVRLSKFLKDSLSSKIVTINTALTARKRQEIAENKISTGEDGSYDFESFLSFNGIESVDVALDDSTDMDECDIILKELSEIIYPQVSYVMLLKDYEVSQDEFQQALKYQMNFDSNMDENNIDMFETLTETIGRVILSNKEKLSNLFGLHRLKSIELAK